MKNDKNWSTVPILMLKIIQAIRYNVTGLQEYSTVMAKFVVSLTEMVLKKAHCESVHCLSQCR